MENKKMNNLASLVAMALGLSLLVGLATAYAANIYVTKAGCPDPDGSAVKPYHMVESAIFRAKSSPGSTVLIEGGKKYYETLTVNTPCTLTATGGTATIGKMDYTASTTLDIITLNTHLAGDETLFPSWEDCWRAEDIADQLKAMPDKPDVVAFQEIWDQDFFKGGDCDGEFEILRESGYEYGRHGKRVFGSIMNSGLALMSNYDLSGWKQKQWEREGGEWATAKGFIRATIIKDEFSIGLFTLHTKAEYDASDREIRSVQLFQLLLDVRQYRVDHPSHVVFVMGDFNIKGEGSEYYNSLVPWSVGFVGGVIGLIENEAYDAARNSPGFIVDRNFRGQWTSDDSNLLSFYFTSPADNARLDYIFYIPSLDGSIEVLPTYVDVLPFRGRDYRVCISRIIDPLGAPHCTPPWPLIFDVTNVSSDHWSIHGKFKLIRK